MKRGSTKQGKSSAPPVTKGGGGSAGGVRYQYGTPSSTPCTNGTNLGDSLPKKG
jgi:hypothetical protein